MSEHKKNHFLLIQFLLVLTITAFALGNSLGIQGGNLSGYSVILPEAPEIPRMLPPGLNGWQDSTSFAFKKQKVGIVWYTLDGSNPLAQTGSTAKYYDNNQLLDIWIKENTKVRAVAINNGVVSGEVAYDFIKAGSSVLKKWPTPIGKFGGDTSFYGPILCTLSVASSEKSYQIKYTLDGTEALQTSPTYTRPLLIDRSMILRAYANSTDPDIKDSDRLQVSFKALPLLPGPQIIPKSQTFSSNPLVLKFKPIKPGLVIRYTLDAALTDWDKANTFSGDSLFLSGLVPNEVITVRAQIWDDKGSISETTIERYTFLPLQEIIASPIATKPTGFFYDYDSVSFSTSTPEAKVWYTLNDQGSSILANSKPISFDSTVRFRVTAYKGQPENKSSTVDFTYTLKLSAPTLVKQSPIFTDSLKVCIKAKAPRASIYYSLDKSLPTKSNGIRLENGNCIDIHEDSTTLYARAILGDVIGEVTSALYIKSKKARTQLSTPSVFPENWEFQDSQSVSLKLPPGDSGEIRYTTDGTVPTSTSKLFLEGNLIFLDSTTRLRSQAFATSDNFDPSSISDDLFILNPSAPFDPMGIPKPFKNSVSVSLKAKSAKAEIRYWIGDVDPLTQPGSIYAGIPLTFNKTTRLQAIAISNSGGMLRKSQFLDTMYEIKSDTLPNSGTDTLSGISSKVLPGGFIFKNQINAPIIVKTISHSPADIVFNGFEILSPTLLIKPITEGQEIKILFTRPAINNGSLYQIVDGRIKFLTRDSIYTLTSAGEYFVANDTLPPRIVFLSREAGKKDSILLNFSVTDNIINPTFTLQSSNLPGGEVERLPGISGLVSIALPNLSNGLNGLWYRASANDFRNTKNLPTNSEGKVYLTQNWEKLNTPEILVLGNKESPWDMTGFPSYSKDPFTWGKVRKDNPDEKLKAMVWDDKLQTSVFLNDSSNIAPGSAFWLYSASKRSSIVLSKFNSGQTDSNGACKMTLRTGWNQVTSPLADKVYWPISTKLSRSGFGLLKTPWRWIPEKQDYQHSDSLEPWVGYFVYYFGEKDTVITLYPNQNKTLAKVAKAAEAAEAGIHNYLADPMKNISIALDFGKLEPLFLGANSFAQDFVGADDEQALPKFQKSFGIWSQRGGHRLATDRVKFKEDVMFWSVILDDPNRQGARLEVNENVDMEANKATEPSQSPIIKVKESLLPKGYEAWAISRSRGMKFRLEPGQEMRLSGFVRDTLAIYIGPAAKLKAISELSQAVSSVEALKFAWQKNASGIFLRLSLPWNADLQVEIRSTSGRILAYTRFGRLNPGNYNLPLPGGNGSQPAFVTIRLRSEKGSEDISQKILW